MSDDDELAQELDALEDAEEDEERLGDSAAMRALLPVGRSGWAIAAGYLGLLSPLLIPAPFAIVAGVFALGDISRNPRKHGKVRAVLGIVLGMLGTAALAITLLG